MRGAPAGSSSARSRMPAISSGGDDGVDDAARVEVLRGLHALGERPCRRAPRRPAGPRKPTSAPGSATVTWPERAPRRHHAAGGGVAQVDEVRQPGDLVRRDRLGDPHHLHERRRALLHPGAAADRRRPAAAAPRAWPARSPRPAGPRRPGRSSRPGTRNSPTRPRPGARASGPRRSAPTRRRRSSPAAARARRRTPRRCSPRTGGYVPRGPRALVEDQVDQLGGGGRLLTRPRLCPAPGPGRPRVGLAVPAGACQASRTARSSARVSPVTAASGVARAARRACRGRSPRPGG